MTQFGVEIQMTENGKVIWSLPNSILMMILERLRLDQIGLCACVATDWRAASHVAAEVVTLNRLSI